MPINRYLLSDFVSVQRQSFFELLENGLIEEFTKRNPITNLKKEFSFFFYPEYYILTRPEYKPQEAIFKNKSYTSKLFVPIQITNKKQKKITLKWVYIGNIPLMTKRGHFILNGAARVIVNQILRSPGIYYQEKIYENYVEGRSTKSNIKKKGLKREYDVSCIDTNINNPNEDSIALRPENTYKRFYCDLICMRGSWLRIEMDKEKNIWAQMKKGPKIPIYWFLLAMGLSEKVIMKSIMDSQTLLLNIEKEKKKSISKEKPKKNNQKNYSYLKYPPEAWKEIYLLIHSKTKISNNPKSKDDNTSFKKNEENGLVQTITEKEKNKEVTKLTQTLSTKTPQKNYTELGRQWFYNRFMNPRTYDLGKQGRIAFNQKLGLNIASHQLTLTGLDVLYATDYLIKVDKGIYNIDDIDHLKNRRVRTSGELIQIQIGVGLVRLEKFIRYSENLFNPFGVREKTDFLKLRRKSEDNLSQSRVLTSSIINNKAFNSAIREFFGTSPLSQFMDQINPLAELTHKRRLSSMGPGGVTRDSATLAIRGIHPTHYGRICPIETPEGKNTGLVNSMTAYARVNPAGLLESPFYKVYKGQVQKNTGMYYLTAEQEEKINLAAPDLFVSPIGFLPKSMIPVRIAKTFTKITRSAVQYIGVSPLQMISIAASLIPFLEHDDANRALMGSNMQRQAVPLIRPERPIVGTGLEARAVSDSGHIIQSQYSGLITYVSAKKIIVSWFLKT